jgi:hypothetical protein
MRTTHFFSPAMIGVFAFSVVTACSSSRQPADATRIVVEDKDVNVMSTPTVTTTTSAVSEEIVDTPTPVHTPV